MGYGVALKRAPLLCSGSSNRGDIHAFLHGPRSKFTRFFARFLLFEKVDYLQWISTIAVFLLLLFCSRRFCLVLCGRNPEIRLKKWSQAPETGCF
uniref:Uncharacterized protein n=1 Tax=Nelumbo nucifera TaxID=4432 RepID=A0A822ZE20_NELNU|nr:TPA_asm: hypothetical protein HUJ06_002663 [Nelumbo nucifera]